MSKEPRHLVSPTAELRRSKCDRDAFAAKRRLPITVVLDRVTQAYNIGAIFRLCDAMLAEQLVITGADVDLRKRNLGQAACGTQFWTPWSQEKTAVEAVLRAKSDGYQVAAVELASNSVRPESFIPKFPVCLVLGGEFDGVSQEVVDLADAVIEIPMRGMANSINVSTAAAIVLYGLSCRAEVEGSPASEQARDRARSALKFSDLMEACGDEDQLLTSLANCARPAAKLHGRDRHDALPRKGRSLFPMSGDGWDRQLDVDLDLIRDQKATVLVTSLEDHEFRLLKVQDLARGDHRQRGMASAPPADRRWRAAGRQVRDFVAERRKAAACGAVGRRVDRRPLSRRSWQNRNNLQRAC